VNTSVASVVDVVVARNDDDTTEMVVVTVSVVLNTVWVEIPGLTLVIV
jgi:hypothetical protein